MLNSNNNYNNTKKNYNNNINLKTPQKNIKELENELNQTIKLREQMVENSLKMKNLNYNYNYNFSKQGFKTPKNFQKFSQQKPGSKSPKPQLQQNLLSKKILQLNITPNQKTQSQNQYQKNQFQNQKNFAKNYFATSAKNEINCNKNLINSNKRISTQQTCYTENNEICSPNKQAGENLRKSHNFFQQKSSNEASNLLDQKNNFQQYCLSANQKQRVKKNPYAHIKPRLQQAQKNPNNV
ncbi:hypothetical protein PPERSA_03679 [Pseudocohnilembus persalinus]|uniref:Uncharacterized protein n=1 Tax=Pseudocohnilembus persalinus TaxID=266149 RepID=A0A0V0QG52_PSEPJ|nr:hypothetical protein PPERSA_03679 [Pseudocohnilembus persalinus]|eukprot:KRX01175.1 hypothetical protein PPERSA_03679 [Pseudocohnilembus persalinus]